VLVCRDEGVESAWMLAHTDMTVAEVQIWQQRRRRDGLGFGPLDRFARRPGADRTP
jgi:hypothetical protein